jgi:hypothetical protein
MKNVVWTAGKSFGSDKVTLYGQSKDSPNLWLEIYEDSSGGFIICKMKDTGDTEKTIKYKRCKIRQIDPIWDAKARELGIPGASYAMEVAEKL